MGNEKADEKTTFITEARRKQIIEAAIVTLNEIGYVKSSLAQIAKRAKVSTALISYHFRDKNDLMNATLLQLITDKTSYISERIQAISTVRDKLHAFIKTSITYHSERSAYNTALIEIVFHARTPDNVPYYKLNNDEDDPLANELHQILKKGQSKGVFYKFNVSVIASAIQGAIDEYLFINSKIDLELCSIELVRLFDRAIVKGGFK